MTMMFCDEHGAGNCQPQNLDARRQQMWTQLRLQAMAITSVKQAKWNKRGKGTEKQTFSSREILHISISKS